MHEHDGGFSVVFGGGRRDRHGREQLRVGKELGREGLQRLDVGAHVVKQVVGDIALQRGRLRHGRLQDGLHGPLGDLGDGGLLLRAGLLHDAAQAPLLPDAHGGIGADDQRDEQQHQIEDLLLQSADFYSVYDFHGLFLFARRMGRSRSRFRRLSTV